MCTLFVRLWAEESGQDLIEYALLTTFVGMAVIAAFDVLRGSIAFVYGTWNAQANSIWETPNPGGP
jgi:Flp pilus assembly pilin Flp